MFSSNNANAASMSGFNAVSTLWILSSAALLDVRAAGAVYVRAFRTAHTPSARSISAASTAILSVLAVRNVLDTSSIVGARNILGVSAILFFRGIYDERSTLKLIMLNIPHMFSMYLILRVYSRVSSTFRTPSTESIGVLTA